MNTYSESTEYSSAPDRERRFTPFAVYGLIALNVLIFCVTASRGGLIDTSSQVLWRFGMISAPDVWNGAWWRLVTGTFLHGGLLHIAVNMWALFNLGAQLEEIYGRARFIVLYLGAGWTGALASLMFSGQSVGASGAIFGLAGAWLAIALRRRHYFQAFGANVLGVVVVNLMIGFSAHTLIDNNGHIGGLIGGFLLGLVMPNNLPEFRDTRWRLPATILLILTFLGLTPLAVRISRDNLDTTRHWE